ncbi:MAG: hypothetical protein RL748_478 [Pseudomonadota bacterium]|jgi:BolA protein
MINETRVQQIVQRLQGTLAPLECQVDDESAQHIGHAGAATGAGHFRLRIVCSQFEGLNLVRRHRLVYDSVRDMMNTEIHALTMTTLAPSEL